MVLKLDILERGQKYLESLQMYCWKIEKISCTNCVKVEEVLYGTKEESSILHTINRRKGTWIVHILRNNCLLRHVIEGKIDEMVEVTGGRGRKCKQLLYENCALLVCYAATSGNFLQTFRDNLSSHIQGSWIYR
jgi:hypothetical protein